MILSILNKINASGGAQLSGQYVKVEDGSHPRQRRHWLAKIRHCFRQCIKSENSKSFGAALFYGLCSISMNFINKAVISSYEFNFPFFIMICQMVVTILILDGLR